MGLPGLPSCSKWNLLWFLSVALCASAEAVGEVAIPDTMEGVLARRASNNSYIDGVPIHVSKDVYEEDYCVCCSFVYWESHEWEGVHQPVLTPLQAACWNGQLDVVRDLASKGANVNDQCPDSGNPLAIAAWKGYLDIVEFLVEHGAKTSNLVDGSNPLSLAVRYNHTEVAKYLSSLTPASDPQDYDDCICCCFVDNGGWNPYDPGQLRITVNNPMEAACMNGSLEVVKALVSEGHGVNGGCCDGGNYVTIAAWRGYLDIVKFLAESGAYVNGETLINNTWQKTLSVAIHNNHTDVVEYLKSKGAVTNP